MFIEGLKIIADALRLHQDIERMSVVERVVAVRELLDCPVKWERAFLLADYIVSVATTHEDRLYHALNRTDPRNIGAWEEVRSELEIAKADMVYALETRWKAQKFVQDMQKLMEDKRMRQVVAAARATGLSAEDDEFATGVLGVQV